MSKEIALFVVLANCFELNWTNSFIRQIYSSGVPVSVDIPDLMPAEHYNYLPSILTDEFLNETRRLHKEILTHLKKGA